MKMILLFTVLYSVFSFAATKLTIIDVVDSDKATKSKSTKMAKSLNVGIFGEDDFSSRKKSKSKKYNKSKN